jgi:hypothetical protein
LTAFSANTQVSIAQESQPIPCAAQTSRESSIFILLLLRYTATYVIIPEMSHIAIAEIGHTNHEAGVIATSQHTAPIAAAIAEGFQLSAHERRIHASAAAAAAVCVVTNAFAARGQEARADQALNQNQPNQRSHAQRMTKGRLFAVLPGCF